MVSRFYRGNKENLIGIGIVKGDENYIFSFNVQEKYRLMKQILGSGREGFLFIYDQDKFPNDILRYFGKYIKIKDLDFNWLNAGILSERVSLIEKKEDKKQDSNKLENLFLY